MKKTRRYKESKSNKSSIKTVILLLAILLIASLFVWLQFTPKPVKEADNEAPRVEDSTENQQPKTETVTEAEKTPNPEGKLTYVDPQPTPPEKSQPDETQSDSTQQQETKTETSTPQPDSEDENIEPRDQDAILAAAVPKVYTVDTDSQQGSGFLFNNRGDIVTNAHVVENNSTVTVTNNTGQEFVGYVVGVSDKVDLALIRVKELAGKEPMAMDLMKSPQGTNVIAIGSPNNQSNTATTGNITAVGNDFNANFTYTDLYEMNAAIAPGSSGGPLLDAKSEKVIGINSIILTDNPSIGYSIPIYSVHQLLQSWEKNPLPVKEQDDPDLAKANFDKELLTIFIEGYMSLYPYAQNEVNFSYLEDYLLPNSPIVQTELEAINSLKDQQKIFTILHFKMEDIRIEKERAFVTTITDTEMTQEGKESILIKEQADYEVIIDEYGDYRIQAIKKSVSSTIEEIPEVEESQSE